jgi:hypothetical protein
MPTQLNGRTIVNGSRYWSHAARGKYSAASFWDPYDDDADGTRRSTPFDRRPAVHPIQHR